MRPCELFVASRTVYRIGFLFTLETNIWAHFLDRIAAETLHSSQTLRASYIGEQLRRYDMWQYDSIQFRKFDPIILMWTKHRINTEKLKKKEKTVTKEGDILVAIYINLINMVKVGLSPSKKLYYLLDWNPFKNDEECFLFHLKSSFRSQDI